MKRRNVLTGLAAMPLAGPAMAMSPVDEVTSTQLKDPMHKAANRAIRLAKQLKENGISLSDLHSRMKRAADAIGLPLEKVVRAYTIIHGAAL